MSVLDTHHTDYQMIMRFLIKGKGVWKHHPFTSEVTTFQMKALKPVLKPLSLHCHKGQNNLVLCNHTGHEIRRRQCY